ncbi:MAG: hypothetical protein HY909_31070 [Deltaproteobacteria bacterium]|nr:hypothetical protein [Deltaproteobacteria bacterium]
MGRHSTLLALFALAGCASATPRGASERALYGDLRRIVESHQRTDWVVDRVEVDALAAVTLRSACQTPPAARRRLAAWLDAELARQGGTARAVYEAHGGSLSAASEALTLERVRLLSRYAEEHAAEDCPFWLTPRGRFSGVHGDARRFVVLAESLGGGGLLIRGGDVTLVGGGGVRLLPGVGVSERVTLAAGIELGGLGTLGANGESGVQALVSGAVPVLLRLQDGSRIVDLEAALTGTWRSREQPLDVGVRVSAGLGLVTLRVGSFMPYGLLWVGYEFQPAPQREGDAHIVQLGTRVGIDWDP